MAEQLIASYGRTNFIPTPGVEGEALPWSELVGRVRPRWSQTHGHRGSFGMEGACVD